MCGLDSPIVTLAVQAAAFDFRSNFGTSRPGGWKILWRPARRGMPAHLHKHFLIDLVILGLATERLQDRDPLHGRGMGEGGGF
ncbi:hypothetical protein GALL_286480 [mine drainage metagenome]|uniref:Uncharacterized protein n=1 Tax=mine drainage metagenome TaxID=410659 RepID=A0A1J5RBH3_9ZZZZ